ncbi:hypothetical protein Psi01_84850 [Planobispora siamensis]|uniref:Uncharacterized protein n=1 Tax=Planobispora siamensis TaxID=936338 RepID=A0A8J3SSF1_9ACTN|nr:hypothetical protein Psi01_84850 [Planobispora siamensis]
MFADPGEVSRVTFPSVAGRFDRPGRDVLALAILGLVAVAGSALTTALAWGPVAGLVMAAVQAVALLRLTTLWRQSGRASGAGPAFPPMPIAHRSAGRPGAGRRARRLDRRCPHPRRIPLCGRAGRVRAGSSRCRMR